MDQTRRLIVPYGLGSNNDAFSMRVYAWNYLPGTDVKTLWIPQLLCEVSGCTLSSTLAGISGSSLLTTEFLCDALTLVTGNPNVSVETLSLGTTDVCAAAIRVALLGHSGSNVSLIRRQTRRP